MPPEGTKKFHTIDYDHHAEEMSHDPWPRWREMRSNCPVAYSESHGGFWVVSRHRNITEVLQDWETFSSVNDRDSPYGGQAIPPYEQRISFVETDPPASLKYRKLVQPELSATRVEALRPEFIRIARGRLERLACDGSFDLIDDYANQVPSRSILHHLGLDEEAWRIWAEPSHRLSHATPGTPEYAEALTGMGEALAFVTDAVDDRLKRPRDDVLTRIVHGRIEGERIGRDEAIELMYVLIMGGMETVVGVMSNAFVYLARNPAARELLIADPGLLPTAADEFLRYFPGSRGVARTTTRDTEIGGVFIGSQERVLTLFGSGNRDEEVFEDPESLRLDRTPNRHLTFGAGVHRCPGDRYTRVELQVVIAELLRVAPNFEIDFSRTEEFRIQPMTTGYVRMPATIGPGGHRDV